MGPYLLVSVLGGVVCAMLASGKQRNVPMWFVIGFFLPLIGVVILLFMADETTPTSEASTPTPAAAKRSRPLDDIRKLSELRDSGVLTELEFEDKKRLVLEAAAKHHHQTATISAAEAREAEVAALLAAAQDRHFKKEFAEAKRMYDDLASRFPTSKQANVARQQLHNLKNF